MPRTPKQEPSLGAFFGLLCLAGLVAIGVGVALEGFTALLSAVLP